MQGAEPPCGSLILQVPPAEAPYSAAVSVHLTGSNILGNEPMLGISHISTTHFCVESAHGVQERHMQRPAAQWPGGAAGGDEEPVREFVSAGFSAHNCAPGQGASSLHTTNVLSGDRAAACAMLSERSKPSPSQMWS
jgi:hypothetical protein